MSEMNDEQLDTLLGRHMADELRASEFEFAPLPDRSPVGSEESKGRAVDA